MGISSSQPGKVERESQLELLDPSGTPSAQQLYFGKQASCLDQYNICEVASGQPCFIVKSDLSAAKRKSDKTTFIYEPSSQEGDGSLRQVAKVTAHDSSSYKWQISLATGQTCDVKVGSKNRRTYMTMTSHHSSSSDGASPQMTWTLRGDNSRQSAVVIDTTDDHLIAHLERHSRNAGQHFKNPHAYVLSAASRADVILLVALGICLDKYENRSREKEYSREIKRRNHLAGYHDADGCGSAFF